MGNNPSRVIFRQLFDAESSTYSYLLADGTSALLIDPVYEQVERDAKLIKELGLDLKYCLNTHVHADHITGSGLLKKHFPECKSVLGEKGNPKAFADIKVPEGTVFKMESIELEFRSTPGHTSGCHTFVWLNKNIAFTGDALLVRGCGRTDFQEGNSRTLYESVWNKIFSLPDETLLYPAHDYKGLTVTSVAEEKKFNPRLTKSENEFDDIMKNLNLPYPKKIDSSLPANLVDGRFEMLSEEDLKKVNPPPKI